MPHAKVFGRNVPLRWEKLEEHFGEYRYKEKEILLEKTDNKEELVQTIAHEILHAMGDRLGFTCTDVSDDMWEIIIECTVICLSDNFQMIPKEHLEIK